MGSASGGGKLSKPYRRENVKKMNNHRQRKEMKEDTLKKVSNDAKRKVLVVEDKN